MKKYRVLGYPKPIVPTCCPNPVIYSDGENYYLAEHDTISRTITAFTPISLPKDTEVIEVTDTHTVYKEVGDPAFYIYSVEDEYIAGEFSEIAEQLYELTGGNKINIHAKLTIAVFLRRRALTEQFLAQIPDRQGNVNFTSVKESAREAMTTFTD